VLSQPNVRYSALATHAIFCLFGWWIASRLLYTSERLGVNFNPNKTVLTAVLLGILCMFIGSLGVMNSAKYSDDLEDHMSDSGSGATVTSLHSVVCYLTIAFAACVTASRYFGVMRGSPSEAGRSRCPYFRPSRSLVVERSS
jgi:ABC-type Fe3+-siderophore transport system permease subunit